MHLGSKDRGKSKPTGPKLAGGEFVLDEEEEKPHPVDDKWVEESFLDCFCFGSDS